MKKIIRKIFIIPIVLYRKFISPLKTRPCCKYYPTCSQYAIDAIEEYGIFKGTAMAIWRLLRCNPFSKGGYDPVVRKREEKTV